METSRRLFLAGSVAAGLLATTGSKAEDTSSPKEKVWRCGLGMNGFMSSSDTFNKTYPIWEVLQFTADTGFDGVELVDGWPMGHYPSADESERIAALRRMHDCYGLQIYSMQTGGSDAHSVNPRARHAWLRQFRKDLRLCKALGGEFIGVWPGGGLEGNPTVDHAIECLALSYREAAQICADEGMYMSFEIEPPFIFNTFEHLQKILAAVDHPACKTNYDPSHFDLMWGSKGKPEEMLEKVGVEHIGHVHLTDTDGTLFGPTSKHLACGDGHCDIAASLKMLWEGNYSGWIMIDAWMIEDAYDAARKGKEAIDAALKRYQG
ncbi:MAG: sugar phosphate isomerase/epimerase [Candidatus Hydrogenedentes bacterium]|jgi:sugar phosphate isomerase/epimerase|nr:sugar phosphate isomerase/epimerase [Candidatus Hydrogenedentota bacterium]